MRSYGWLTGELVRRVTGRTIGRFVADELSGPLALDLWVGLPPSEETRVARLVPPRPPDDPEVQAAIDALLAPETVARARAVEAEGTDAVLGFPMRYGLGFALGPSLPPACGPAAFGHPGAGGSLAFADPEAGLGFGYVMNAMVVGAPVDPRANRLVRAAYAALG